MPGSYLPIAIRDIQAIQGVVGDGRLQAPSLCPPKGSKLRGVTISRLRCCFSPWKGPTAISVPAGYKPACAGDDTVVARKITCEPAPESDQDDVWTIARGVAEGLRTAPLLSTQPAPWVAPNYRGKRDPHTAAVVLSTFAATDVRVIWAQNALASYLTTTNYTVNTAQISSASPVQVLSFQATDDWTGDTFEVASPDMEVLYLLQWMVAINGIPATGYFSLVEGVAPINVQARRTDTISILASASGTDSFAVGLIPILNGWTRPSLMQTDGTYSKILRASPSWPGGGRRA